jgi:hypothetical protein
MVPDMNAAAVEVRDAQRERVLADLGGIAGD